MKLTDNDRSLIAREYGRLLNRYGEARFYRHFDRILPAVRLRLFGDE